jgi:hypothetical protein
MPRFQVKKAVAVSLLEAVKSALEQLGARRLALAERGAPAPPDLSRSYGDVRRMRDYLQRCAGGYGDAAELDLAASDAAVIVACCRHAVAVLDERANETTTAPMDRQTLQKKQALLAHWAVEMAAKPLIELPLPRNSQMGSEAMRELMGRLQAKLFERTRIEAPAAPTRGVIAGVRSLGEQVQSAPRPSEASPPSAPPALPAVEAEPVAAPPAPPAASAPGEAEPLFDLRRIREPRLRSLAHIDMRGYARALAANDHRLATVLMASVLESTLLDHVLARRADFGLTGTPDAWNMSDVLLMALGDQAEAKDRSLAFHLFSARNLLRPAVQIVAPVVVTVASFETLREFVLRAVHALGYGARVEASSGAGAPTADPTC